MREIEIDGIKYESSVEYALDWCDGIRAATEAPGCDVSEEELWLESGISQLNAQKSYYKKGYNELKQKLEAARYWMDRYLERDEYCDEHCEQLEEKLEKIKTILEADCDE